MANDFKKREASKTERIIYELAMQVHDMDNRVWSTSSHLLAMGILLNIDPKKMAEMLTGDASKIKEYAQKINDAIQEIEKNKTPEQKAAEAEHMHGHDHTHGHDHEHDHEAEEMVELAGEEEK